MNIRVVRPGLADSSLSTLWTVLPLQRNTVRRPVLISNQPLPPILTPEQEALLIETAVDLGKPGPDDAFGYGRINIAAALDRVLAPDITPLLIIVLVIWINHLN